jgi:hypothetical protein
MDQDLLQQRLREARAGQQSTTCASLPPELLGSIVEYAFTHKPSHHPKHWDGSWLGSLLRAGCINSSFLESLKYVGRLEVDIIKRRWPSRIGDRRDMLPSRCDADVRRWCDIASRRLRHLQVMRERGGRNTFNPLQTKLIVDCAASFPNLQELQVRSCEVVTACTSLALHVRAGRFSNLRRLDVESFGSDLSVAQRDESSTFNLRRIAKFAFDELVSQLPPDLGIDVLVHGVYPTLMEIGDEVTWDQWVSTFFDLVAKGADVRSRPILVEVVRAYEYRYLRWRPSSPKKMEAFYSTVERLLTVQDPNSLTDDLSEALWLMLERLSEALRAIEDDSDDSDYVPEFDAETLEPLFRHLMRTIDLLVRHGGKSPKAGPVGPLSGTDRDAVLYPWILARHDCTQGIRDAVARGELHYHGF